MHSTYGSTRMKQGSLHCLARLASPIALPELAQACEDQNALARQFALSALHRIGPSAQPVVHQIIARMDDPVSDVRIAAARALKIVGYGVEEATESLLHALSDPIPAVRNAAAYGLGPRDNISTDARIVSALSKTLSDESGEVRLQAITSLERLFKKDREAFNLAKPQIMPLLEEVKRQGAMTYQSESTASTAFSRAVAFAHMLTRTLTVEDNVPLEGDSKRVNEEKAIEDLVYKIGHAKRHGDRRRAAEGLGDYGQTAEKAAPALREAVVTKWKGDPHGTIRRAALRALAAVAPDDNRTLDVALKALDEDESWTVREHAIFALKRTPFCDSPRVVESLKRALKDPSERIVWASVKALTELGSEAGNVFEDYLDLLRSTSEPSMREHFVRAAGWLLKAQREDANGTLPAESRNTLRAIVDLGSKDPERTIRRLAHELAEELDAV